MLERLENNMSMAANDAGPASEAFKAIGIDVKDLQRNLKSLDAILPEIAEKFKASADGPAKTAIAIALMGRAGADMIPVLNKGAAGLDEFKKKAQDTGTALSSETVASLSKTRESLTDVNKAVEGLAASFVDKLGPAIQATAGFLANMAKGLREVIDSTERANDLARLVQIDKDMAEAQAQAGLSWWDILNGRIDKEGQINALLRCASRSSIASARHRRIGRPTVNP